MGMKINFLYGISKLICINKIEYDLILDSLEFKC